MDGVARALPFVLLLLFGYYALIRPARKRAKETAQLQSRLSPGDQIMLTSGIFGRVESMLDDKFTIEIAPDVVVTVHRGAIGKIVRDEPAAGDLAAGDLGDARLTVGELGEGVGYEDDDAECEDDDDDDAEYGDDEYMETDPDDDGLDEDANTEATNLESDSRRRRDVV